MNIRDYLKINKIILVGNAIVCIIINMILFASIDINKGLDDIIYINFFIITIELVSLIYDFKRKKSKYEKFMSYIDKDENIEFIIRDMEDLDVKILYEVIKKYKHEFINIENNYKKNINELQDYMTQWVHDIKVNIAVSELLIQDIEEENHNISKLYYQIEQMKFRINQVLNVSRATHYSQDILSERVNIDNELRNSIRNNATFFINKNIEINTDIKEIEVISDRKWVQYIFTQILNNSSKYTGENGQVNIFTREDSEAYYVHIRDNGIGIPEEDRDRIFNKGFTGKNGRSGTKSTGMGLHYVGSMAKVLGMGIEVKSKEGEYTEFKLSFYKLSDYYNVTSM